jgi:hypothetical protein
MKRIALLLLLLVVSAVPSLAQSTTVRIRGTIVSLEGNVITVATAAGENHRVNLADPFRVVFVVKTDFAKIVPGVYVGAAAVTQPDGTLRAREVHIFPEAMRGTGEGHQPYDLGPQSTMTNGTVDAMALVESVGDRVLTLKYKDGEKQIVVPKETPIVIYEPADAKALVPGAHVYIVAQRSPDAAFTAARVNVGKNGLVPPM